MRKEEILIVGPEDLLNAWDENSVPYVWRQEVREAMFKSNIVAFISNKDYPHLKSHLIRNRYF